MNTIKINLFGFLLSQVGWSGDTATGRRGVTSQGWRNDVNALFDFLSKENVGLLDFLFSQAQITKATDKNEANFIDKVVNNSGNKSKLYTFIKIQSDL
jgi:hypothetical protein